MGEITIHQMYDVSVTCEECKKQRQIHLIPEAGDLPNDLMWRAAEQLVKDDWQRVPSDKVGGLTWICPNCFIARIMLKHCIYPTGLQEYEQLKKNYELLSAQYTKAEQTMAAQAKKIDEYKKAYRNIAATYNAIRSDFMEAIAKMVSAEDTLSSYPLIDFDLD